MKIEAIATDLDGTLLNSHHHISKVNCECLKRCEEKGIKIIVVTGRHQKDMAYLKEDYHFSGYGVFCGGCEIGNFDNNKSNLATFSKEEKKFLYDIARE